MIAVAYSDLNLRLSRNFFDDYLIFFESIRVLYGMGCGIFESTFGMITGLVAHLCLTSVVKENLVLFSFRLIPLRKLPCLICKC